MIRVYEDLNLEFFLWILGFFSEILGLFRNFWNFFGWSEDVYFYRIEGFWDFFIWFWEFFRILGIFLSDFRILSDCGIFFIGF